MEQQERITKIAGIDVGKTWLDVAVHGGESTRVANTASGIGALLGWLRTRGVGRVGMEATGGYERAVREAAGGAGFEVVLHQPLEVRLFARLKRRRAKTDKLDAVLIAAATAQVDTVRAAADPRLAELAERLTAYEQVSEQLARTKTQMEHLTAKDLVRLFKAQLRGLETLKTKLMAKLVDLIMSHADLARRFQLLMSLPGVGPVTAASLVVRMPELGAMKRGQAASLLGVAPIARESGQYRGQSFIGGGRARPRRMLYLAAMTARRCDAGLRDFAAALVERGKPPKVVLVAVMRKLIEAANLVLARDTPWEASRRDRSNPLHAPA